jgi:hypothetical protein
MRLIMMMTGHDHDERLLAADETVHLDLPLRRTSRLKLIMPDPHDREGRNIVNEKGTAIEAHRRLLTVR